VDTPRPLLIDFEQKVGETVFKFITGVNSMTSRAGLRAPSWSWVFWLFLAANGVAQDSPKGFPPAGLHPTIQKIAGSVSEERLESTLRKLESFQTRNTFSEAGSPTRGIGAARQWIFDQFRSFSPRLQVAFDTYSVAQQGGRLVRDVELRNVVAVLPGTDPAGRNRRFIISGHYDSTICTTAQGQTSCVQGDTPAPGVNDDSSGIAVVLEAARILSQYEFPHTLVFVAFAGEEQGLVGSSLLAQKARRENWEIDALLNNDIVGNSLGGNGRVDNHTVRIFSEEPNDSPSRQVARYVKAAGERYVPSMTVDMIFRYDRFGRGGDHSPFNQEGFPAVRITVSDENYSRQHTVDDTLEGVDMKYLARVAQVNIASLASLALAPSAPLIQDDQDRPMIGRGPSGYDTALRWMPGPGDVGGYAILMRKTTSPDWEKEVFVGKVTEFVLKDVSIDAVVFGVKAIGQDGTESLTSTYINPPRSRTEYNLIP
jgi:hypothetical protein